MGEKGFQFTPNPKEILIFFFFERKIPYNKKFFKKTQNRKF
uniref:Uncharacterized protein n=1 Tax=Chionoecetes opilio bacilliform virus TaxID=1825681 RepID=A0A1Q3DL77_9VIRU|nr:hypothetical protein SCV_140 [Chionoecetes opilio bacilliform virus]